MSFYHVVLQILEALSDVSTVLSNVALFGAKCDISITVAVKDLEDLHDSLSRDKQAKANSVTKNAAALLGTSDPNAIRLPTDFLPQVRI